MTCRSDSAPAARGRSRTEGLAIAVVVAGFALAALVPATPAVAQETPGSHVVKKGDTLWDLAARYLSDPFQWHRIFDLNRSMIDDPHWIYPGQEFRLPGAVQDGSRVASGDQAEARARGAAAEAGASAGDVHAATGAERAGAFDAPSIFDHSPEASVNVNTMSLDRVTPPDLVSMSDYLRAGFVTSPASVSPHAVTARIMSQNPLGLELPSSVRSHDRIMIALNGLSVSEGDFLQAIRPGRNRGSVGREYASMGLVEVTGVEGDSARAVVRTVYGDYQVGDLLVPAGSPGDVGTELTAVQNGMVARLLGFETEQPLLSTGDMVFVDAGSREGVEVGDEFAVFPADIADVGSASLDDRLSVVRVVRTFDHTASARVVDTRDVGTEADAPVRLVRRPSAAGG